MSVESSLNLTPTLSLVRRGSIYPDALGGVRGVDLGYICKTEMLPRNSPVKMVCVFTPRGTSTFT
jgi:hypothetical protein